MKIKSLPKDCIGKSCIVKQKYQTEKGIGYEEFYITDILKAYFSDQDLCWCIIGNVFKLETPAFFDEKFPFYDIIISYEHSWPIDKYNSVICTIDEADFEFASKETVLEKLKERIGKLMGE